MLSHQNAFIIFHQTRRGKRQDVFLKLKFKTVVKFYHSDFFDFYFLKGISE